MSELKYAVVLFGHLHGHHRRLFVTPPWAVVRHQACRAFVPALAEPNEDEAEPVGRELLPDQAAPVKPDIQTEFVADLMAQDLAHLAAVDSPAVPPRPGHDLPVALPGIQTRRHLDVTAWLPVAAKQAAHP